MNQTFPKIILKKGRAQPIWQGHPWVFSGALSQIEGNPDPGSLVQVYDQEKHFVGTGFYNPNSQITIRMVTLKEEPFSSEDPSLQGEQGVIALLQSRIHQAASLRKRLLLPSKHTNAFRLVNSEGDRLPGLTIDRYADWALVQFTSLAMKQREEVIYKALLSLPLEFRPRVIAELQTGKFAQIEGFFSANRIVHGEKVDINTVVSCIEEGILYEVSPLHGQKTGLFLDQRENRSYLSQYAKDARFLDLYSYVGGFSLQALRQGAKSATCVDSSSRALEQAKKHAQLNGFHNLETIEADAFRFLETVTPYSYDVVVVDPPKFASAQKDMDMALKGYLRLNTLAFNAVAKGGLLASCSCSQLIDAQSFERMLAKAAREAGRQVSLLTTKTQGPDHLTPPGFSEGRYLKFMLLSVQ